MLFTYLQISRWKNISLMLYTFIVIRFFLFPSFDITSSLSLLQFSVFSLAIVSIMSSGYMINDLCDIQTDSISKPTKRIITTKISIETAKLWYKLTLAIGLFLGIIFSLSIHVPSLSLLFVGVALLLYYYATTIKAKGFIGNITVAMLIAFTIALPVLVEFLLTHNIQQLKSVVSISIWLSLVAFCSNLVREILKDCIDIRGDYKLKMNTLPIVLGIKRSLRIAVGIYSVLILGLGISILFIQVSFFVTQVKWYLFVFCILPMIYNAFHMLDATSVKKQQQQSTILKICMFLGINSLLILSIFYHA